MRYVFSIILVLITAFSFGQSLRATESMIPSNVEMVSKVDLEAIDNWLEGAQTEATDELKSVDEDVVQWILQNDVVIDRSADMFIYEIGADSLQATVIVAPINGPEGIPEMVTEQFNEQAELLSERSFQYALLDYHSVGFDSEHLVFISYTVPWSWYWQKTGASGDYYMEDGDEGEAEELRREEIREEMILTFLKTSFGRKWEEPLSGLKVYNEAKQKDSDILVMRPDFMSLAGDIGGIGNTLMGRSPYENSNSSMEVFGGNHQVNHIDLTDEGMKTLNQIHFNETFAGHAKKMFKAKFDGELLKYVDGTQLSGLYSLTFDPEGLIDMGAAMFEPIIDQTQGRTAIFGSAMEIAGALIDREKLENVFDGQVVLAVTGMREVDVLYSRYEYDQVSYQRTRVIESKKEKRPEYVFLMRSSNEDVANKMIDLLVSQGRLTPRGDFYTIRDLKGSGKSDIYVAYIDRILIVSNDEELMNDYVVTGLPKSKQVNRDIQKKLKSNALYAWLDMSELVGDNAVEDIQKMFNGPLSVGVGKVDPNWLGFEIRGMENKGNVFTSEGNIELDPSLRSLISEVLLRLNKPSEEDMKYGSY